MYTQNPVPILPKYSFKLRKYSCKDTGRIFLGNIRREVSLTKCGIDFVHLILLLHFGLAVDFICKDMFEKNVLDY